jgi:hypothetical protein
LYTCGSGTHPGGGVTGAPGHNAAREVLRDFTVVLARLVARHGNRVGAMLYGSGLDTVPYTGTPNLFNRDYIASMATPEFKRFSFNAFMLYGQDENFPEWSSAMITSASGTLAWAVDVNNPATGEAFTVTLKEVQLPSGDSGLITRPCALGFSGNYPRALDGLARLLSLDMRVMDPGWIAMKLRKLLNVGEPLGHFMAPVPGERRQQTWPSTVAYIARLVIHRHAMLGVLDEQGFPVQAMGILAAPVAKPAAADGLAGSVLSAPVNLATMAGKACPECGNHTLIHKDGCEFCTACGYVGQCG